MPDEANPSSHWRWERGAWVLVDRVSATLRKSVCWNLIPIPRRPVGNRDYVSYCGVSDHGKKLYAMVVQLGRRKPILKKALGEVSGDGMPDSECPVPAWQRQPTCVTFAAKQKTDEKFTDAVRGHAVDLLNENSRDDAEEGTKQD